MPDLDTVDREGMDDLVTQILRIPNLSRSKKPKPESSYDSQFEPSENVDDRRISDEGAMLRRFLQALMPIDRGQNRIPVSPNLASQLGYIDIPAEQERELGAWVDPIMGRY